MKRRNFFWSAGIAVLIASVIQLSCAGNNNRNTNSEPGYRAIASRGVLSP
ncbi:MAG TPA: hypothetical protein VJ919_16290 [Tangfeifania sp.]|nr:hypothetical protein [Tangfeifania sp.]